MSDTTAPEPMFWCDWPGCEVEYPAFEPLRGLEAFGVEVGRKMLEADGWYVNRAEDADYCPAHADDGRAIWALNPEAVSRG